MEEIKLDIPDGYEFFGINDDNKVVLTKKKPQYPKTYEECLKILGYTIAHTIPMNNGHNGLLLMKLQRLLINRDAYWKIAGDWKPNFTNQEKKFIIANYYGKVYPAVATNYNRILIFPTEEMRDAFYENFKELIEECKELL